MLDVSGRPRASRDFSYPHQLAPAARARFMAACGQSVYYKATANGVDRGTVEFTGDGHAAGESSVEFTHRAHVVRLPHDEHPLSCTCGRPDCSGEPCKHVPPLFSILAKAGTLEVSELDLFHPLYHSATLRRLYVDIMRGVDVVATTCIRDCDKDGLLPPLWQLERVTTFLKKRADQKAAKAARQAGAGTLGGGGGSGAASAPTAGWGRFKSTGEVELQASQRAVAAQSMASARAGPGFAGASLTVESEDDEEEGHAAPVAGALGRPPAESIPSVLGQAPSAPAPAIASGKKLRQCPRCLGHGHFSTTCRAPLSPEALHAWEVKQAAASAKPPKQKKQRTDGPSAASPPVASQSAVAGLAALLK